MRETMDFRIIENRESGILEIIPTGYFSWQAYKEMLEQLIKYDYHMQGNPVLLNVTTLRHDDLCFKNLDSISKIASYMIKPNIKIRRATLVNKLDFEFGIARIWTALEEFNSDDELMIFTDRDEALAWLTVDDKAVC